MGEPCLDPESQELMRHNQHAFILIFIMIKSEPNTYSIIMNYDTRHIDQTHQKCFSDHCQCY